MNTFRTIAGPALAFAVLAATAQPAHAGSVINVKIVEVATTSTQHATIKFSVNIGSKATCATVVNSMAIDLTTSKGRGALSIATAALLGNLNVLAIGTTATSAATCTDVFLTSGGAATKYETLWTLAIVP